MLSIRVYSLMVCGYLVLCFFSLLHLKISLFNKQNLAIVSYADRSAAYSVELRDM